MANDDNASSPPRTSQEDSARPTTFAESLARAAEDATQSTTRLSSLTEFHATAAAKQTETNRRRAANKTAYYAFAEAAEDRRQRLCDLIARNDRSSEMTEKDAKPIAEGTGDLAVVRAANEALKEGRRLQMARMADEVKRDIKTQRQWDAFYALRSDEPPGGVRLQQPS
ncbi:hypothetical protein LTR12_001368 [Friedmanniomyces endolithicus]|nr:hypothetical protein LTR74_004528 [Friedmanniomyces endolithicus]KAK1824302.1 hypothetical protein LTR12_001368 [Friedmanniomyces endolithicus]